MTGSSPPIKLIKPENYFKCQPNQQISSQTGRNILMITHFWSPPWEGIYNIYMKYFQDSLSTQIIIPQKQIGRKSDIYVTMVSTTNQVASKGWFVAMISTTVETDNPEAEIQPGLNLLGPIKQKFFQVFIYFLNSKII